MRGLKLFFPLLFSLCLAAALTGAPDSARGLSSSPSEATKPRSLCAESERVVWSCEMMKDGKLASLCSSKDLSESRGYVQYRFGRAGRVELEFPRERSNTQAAFKYSRYTRPLVTMLKLEFANDGFTYTIIDDSNEEEKTAQRYAALIVKPSGADSKETTLRCRLPIRGSLMTLEGVVQRLEETNH